MRQVPEGHVRNSTFKQGCAEDDHTSASFAAYADLALTIDEIPDGPASPVLHIGADRRRDELVRLDVQPRDQIVETGGLVGCNATLLPQLTA
ncbi:MULTISPECIES: hypothetical protein [unclassified Streptomyces]|uniref:hypothetical protein n=1 Tax=unclassified Streptomyces TaxID=2593676 RepID=UPI0035DF55A5